MKKIYLKSLAFLFTAFLSTFMLLGCASPISNEEAIENTVKTVLFAIAEGKTDVAIGNITFPNVSEEDMAAITLKMPDWLLQSKAAVFDPQGGLKSVDIMDKVISSDHDKATVNYILVFKDGSNVDGRMGLLKVDGKWKSILSFIDEEKP